MNNDDISHFSTIPASFAIKSNVYFIAHQYLIINNSQSQRALSVSVRTVLWIYFASRRNCGLLPSTRIICHLYYGNFEMKLLLRKSLSRHYGCSLNLCFSFILLSHKEGGYITKEIRKQYVNKFTLLPCPLKVEIDVRVKSK